MVSDVVKKEKNYQKDLIVMLDAEKRYFGHITSSKIAIVKTHKHGLFGLKESLEDHLDFFEFMVKFVALHGLASDAKECIELNKKLSEVKEDIEKLTKIIAEYDRFRDK